MSRPLRPTAPPLPAAALPAVAPPDLDGMLKRLALPTIRRLHAELAVRVEAEGMGYRAYLDILVAEEIAHRAETRLRRAVRAAQFPALRTIDDFNFTFQSALRRQMLGSYLGVECVTDGRSATTNGGYFVWPWNVHRGVQQCRHYGIS